MSHAEKESERQRGGMIHCNAQSIALVGLVRSFDVLSAVQSFVVQMAKLTKYMHNC